MVGAAAVEQKKKKTKTKTKTKTKKEEGEKLTEKETQSYARQLEDWAQEKLAQWDNDEKFRKKRKKKHKTRELYEESLREKMAEQIKANSSPV